MTGPLFPNQLERLLPALRHVAELVQRNGTLSREDVQLLLLTSGLDEAWAVGELERWVENAGSSARPDGRDQTRYCDARFHIARRARSVCTVSR